MSIPPSSCYIDTACVVCKGVGMWANWYSCMIVGIMDFVILKKKFGFTMLVFVKEGLQLLYGTWEGVNSCLVYVFLLYSKDIRLSSHYHNDSFPRWAGGSWYLLQGDNGVHLFLHVHWPSFWEPTFWHVGYIFTMELANANKSGTLQS